MSHLGRFVVAAAFAALLFSQLAGSGLLAAELPETDTLRVPVVFGELAADQDPASSKVKDPDTPVFAFVELQGPAVFEILNAIEFNTGLTQAEMVQEGRAQTLHRSVAQRQDAMRPLVEATGAKVVGQLQTTLNALDVIATPRQLAELSMIEGVKRVTIAQDVQVMLEDSVPHIGAQRVMDELGLDGTGTIVAVIDSGVDYYHEALGGSGNVAEREADDPTILEEGTFPNAKIVGGYDFAGGPVGGVNPDDDPIDFLGHGSHVSGIVGGNETATVPHGVAPGNTMLSLKVGWDDPNLGSLCPTCIMDAIEWCANHNLYIDDPDNEMVPGTRPEGKIQAINMSLGNGWGGNSYIYNSVLSQAIEQGITVVASAGNSGPIPYVTGNPSASMYSLSVASSLAPGETALAVTSEWVEGEEDKVQVDDALQGAADWLTTQLAATGVITAELAWYGDACNDENGERVPPVQEVSEKIALVARGTCPFYDKLMNAAAEGAIASLVFTDAERDKAVMGCGAPSDCANGPGIPAVMINHQPGLDLQALLEAGTTVMTTLDPAGIPLDYLTDTVSGFSSRGPGRRLSSLKPQITAPGGNINSVAAGTGTGSMKLSGTSMSGPTVAGTVSLLWQRNIDQNLGLGAHDIAALAMNYSNPVIAIGRSDTGPRAGTTRQGAGLVQAYDSAMRNTLVRSDTGIAELSFGNVFVQEETQGFDRTITVNNLSDAPKTYAIDWTFAFEDEDGEAGVSLSAEPSTVTVDGGSSADVVVTMNVDPEGVRDWFELDANPLEVVRFTTHEVDGYLRLTETDDAGAPLADGDVVGVPFHTLPRRAACAEQDTNDSFEVSGEGTDSAWTNECGAHAQLGVFWLGGTDELESNDGDDLPAELDIAAIGVRYGQIADVNTGAVNDTLEFAIATAGHRRMVYETDYFIYIDVDQDETLDKVVIWAGVPTTTIYVAPVADNGIGPNPDGNLWVPVGTMLWDVDESVMLVSVPLSALDESMTLENGDLAFDYGVSLHDFTEDYSDGTPPGLNNLVHDMAPDDMLSGGRFTFDQAVHDCVTLTDMDGEPIAAPGRLDTLDANQSVVGNYALACNDLEALPDDFGTLSYYANNLPDMDRYSMRLMSPPARPIFLPLGLQGYELGMEEGQ